MQSSNPAKTGSIGHAVPDAVAPPPGNPRFPLFDGLRALAVLGVFMFQLAAITGHLESGWKAAFLGQLKAGVALFFLVSAFLLYRPYVSARIEGRRAASLNVYARRRALRILPAYFLALTLLAVYPGLNGVFTAQWWAYYGFAQNFQADTVFNGIPPAWSLATEVTFYAFLPVYALVLALHRFNMTLRRVIWAEGTALAVLFFGAFAFRELLPNGDNSYPLTLTLAGTFDWFALGMALAVTSAVLVKRDHRPRAIGLIERFPSLCWLGALVILTLGAVSEHDHIHGEEPYTGAALRLSFGVFAFLTLLPAVFGDDRRGFPRRVLSASLTAWLGLVSYGIFLYHFPVMLELADRIGPHISGWSALPTLVLGVIALLVTIGLASASYYIVERPLLRLKHRKPSAPAV